MSPAAARAAEALGYTNVKIYHDGIPVWTQKNPLVITPQQLFETYTKQEHPIITLDTRTAAAATALHLPNAVHFPVADEAAIDKLPNKQIKPPIVVYDQNGKGEAAKIARTLVAAGYPNTRVMSGGFDAWKTYSYAPPAPAPPPPGIKVAAPKPVFLPVDKQPLLTKISYTPKPKPGEISIAGFQKLVAKPAKELIILDVRNTDELKEGKFAGSVNIPVDALLASLEQLPKEKQIVLHCSSGVRAEMGYNTLKSQGYKNVSFLNAKLFFEDGQPEYVP